MCDGHTIFLTVQVMTFITFVIMVQHCGTSCILLKHATCTVFTGKRNRKLPVQLMYLISGNKHVASGAHLDMLYRVSLDSYCQAQQETLSHPPILQIWGCRALPCSSKSLSIYTTISLILQLLNDPTSAMHVCHCIYCTAGNCVTI